MIKPPASTQSKFATVAPSVVSNLTDDIKPNTNKVDTSTSAEESTDGTVLAVSPKASQTAQNLAGTPTSAGTAGSNKEAAREASLANSVAKSATEANLDASTTEANNTQNTTEFGLNRPNSSTRNQPIAGSRVNQRQANWRKAKAKKKQELKQLGMHVWSRPFLARNTNAFVSKRDRN